MSLMILPRLVQSLLRPIKGLTRPFLMPVICLLRSPQGLIRPFKQATDMPRSHPELPEVYKAMKGLILGMGIKGLSQWGHMAS